MAEKSDLSTAYHEAGHAVVGLVRGLDVYHLTIIPDPHAPVPSAGDIDCRHNPQAIALADGYGEGVDDIDGAFNWIEGRALSLLAGATAQQMFTGEWQMDTAQDDMNNLVRWVELSYLPPEPTDEEPLYAPPFVWVEDDDGLVTNLVDQAWDRWGDECREILTANWAWVEAIAQAAFDGDGNLTGDEMLALRC